MDRLDGAVGLLVRLQAVLASVFILLIMLMACLEVFFREVFNRSYAILAEFPVFLNLGAAYFGLTWVQRRRRHIFVEALYERLPAHWQRRLSVFNTLMVLVVALVLLWQGYRLVAHSYAMGTSTITTVRFPIYLPQLVLPIAGLTLALEAGLQMLKLLAGRDLTVPEDPDED